MHTMNDEELIHIFPFTPNRELCKRFDLTIGQLNARIRKYDLYKSSDYIANLRSAQNKGRNHTDEAKKRIKDHQRSLAKVRRGEKHHSWKGGNPWKRFADPLYKEWRKAVLERDNYTCQHCLRKCKKYEKGLAAHHIKPYAKFPESRLDIDNGLTLCRQCHRRLHGTSIKPKQPILCACGCGESIEPYDVYGRKRTHKKGHSNKNRKLSIGQRESISLFHKGRKKSVEFVESMKKNRQGNKTKRTSSSKYVGVSWNKRLSKWQSYITIDKKRRHLGFFKEEIYAAQAYDEAAFLHFSKSPNCNRSS